MPKRDLAAEIHLRLLAEKDVAAQSRAADPGGLARYGTRAAPVLARRMVDAFRGDASQRPETPIGLPRHDWREPPFVPAGAGEADDSPSAIAAVPIVPAALPKSETAPVWAAARG